MDVFIEFASLEHQETSSTLVSTIELKDVYTKGHASRGLEFSLDLSIAYCQYEHYDGGEYPRGLKEEENQ